MLAEVSAASTPGGSSRRGRPSRFSFWVDRAGTLGPVLLRYDLRGRGPRRGARLGVDGRWHASTQPEGLMWTGTGSGDAITADQAREVARQLGFADLDLTDPEVLP
ncbi:hypothetical protein GCM10023200_08390 [Actinomycetospora chlora]|uniref:Uncharacterized protein n=1 Tax=Actinomycetospora chlora TaxID=663608 RepID=A0ABP9ABA0_9PSEU